MAVVLGARPAPAAPAALRGVSPPLSASGLASDWDFGVTDLAYKSELGEIWVLDGHFVDPTAPAAPVVPVVRRFQAGDLVTPSQALTLALPAELEGGRALGIAEIPHGTARGMNLLLVDKNFVDRLSGSLVPQEAYFVLYDDQGSPDAGTVPSRPSGLPDDAMIYSIAVNPEREEIAAYDLTTHSVYLLDFTFTWIGQTIPLQGLVPWFVGGWAMGPSTFYGAGQGIEYLGADSLLAASSFFNQFEGHLVLEYDLAANGAYSGRAIDLSAAVGTGSGSDLTFVPIAVGKAGDSEVLAAVNFADEAVYAFDLQPAPQPPPVAISLSGVLDDGRYRLEWTLPAAAIDAIRVFENGVQVASLPPDSGSWESPLPLVGKGFVEVATEAGGVISEIRPIVQLEDSGTPALEGVQFTATRMTGRQFILGVAATPVVEALADFRLYVVSGESNVVSVLDHKLSPLPDLVLDPPLQATGDPTPRGNPVAWGVAIVPFGGRQHLAVLDSDGPGGSGPPSAAFYALEGPTAGSRSLAVDAIDLSSVFPQPTLLDWDADSDGNLLAGGFASGQPVIVRIVFNGQTLRAVQSAPIPHGLLTSRTGGPMGIGVSVLPSGNLLVAGADAFHQTYSEALLVTPLTGDPATSARVIGHAQGLIGAGQFNLLGTGALGPEIGPDVLFGMDTAFFPSATGTGGVGVTYLPASDLRLLRGALGWVLTVTMNLVIHSTNDCSDPGLVASPLGESRVSVPVGGAHRTDRLVPTFSSPVPRTSYYYYVISESEGPLSLEVEALLDGASASTAAVTIEPQRYHRGALLEREEGSLEIVVRNAGEAEASIRILAGAMGIGSSEALVSFRRGDSNADGATSITDAIFTLNWLFKGGDEPACQDAADVDDNGAVNLTDPVSLLTYLFRSGDPPLPPGPDDCGPDDTEDEIASCGYPTAACQ